MFAINQGQEKALEILELLNEILVMLQLPLQELCSHVVGRISEFPSAGLVSSLIAYFTALFYSLLFFSIPILTYFDSVNIINH